MRPPHPDRAKRKSCSTSAANGVDPSAPRTPRQRFRGQGLEFGVWGFTSSRVQVFKGSGVEVFRSGVEVVGVVGVFGVFRVFRVFTGFRVQGLGFGMKPVLDESVVGRNHFWMIFSKLDGAEDAPTCTNLHLASTMTSTARPSQQRGDALTRQSSNLCVPALPNSRTFLRLQFRSLIHPSNSAGELVGPP